MPGGREGEAGKEGLLHPKLRSVMLSAPESAMLLPQSPSGRGVLQEQLVVSAVVIILRVGLCVCCECPSS